MDMIVFRASSNHQANRKDAGAVSVFVCYYPSAEKGIIRQGRATRLEL